MIYIRQATIADSSDIESIYLKKVKQLAAKGLKQWDEEEVLFSTLSKMYTIDCFYLVYFNGCLVGGFIVVDYDPTYWLYDKPKQALYIHKVMVLDEAEKKGISNAILDYFKQLGIDKGYPSVKLDVRESKPKLRAFYERNGFVLKEIVDLNKGYLTCLYEYKLK